MVTTMLIRMTLQLQLQVITILIWSSYFSILMMKRKNKILLVKTHMKMIIQKMILMSMNTRTFGRRRIARNGIHVIHIAEESRCCKRLIAASTMVTDIFSGRPLAMSFASF